MASKKYDVCVAQKGKDDKTYWRNIGVILKTEKGFSLKIEAVPVGWDGWAALFEPEQKEKPEAKPTKDADIPF